MKRIISTIPIKYLSFILFFVVTDIGIFRFAVLTHAQQSTLPYVEEFADPTFATVNWPEIESTPELVSVTVSSSSANELFISAHPSAFEAATAQLGVPSIIDFEDVESSLTNSNTYLGRDEFDGSFYAYSGITFSNPNGYPLFISPGLPLSWNPSNSLSVGRFPYDPAPKLFAEDDDLTINLATPCVAIGFTFVDNFTGEGEFVLFLNSSGDTIAQVVPPPNYFYYRAFLGIISPNDPIAAVKIIELDNDGDDVNYDDFFFFMAAVTSVEDTPSNASPQYFKLWQNYPNPFNPITTVEFSLLKRSPVTLKVFDIRGKEVATLVDNEVLAAGKYKRIFDAGHLSNGVYLYRMRVRDFSQTRKLTVLK